MSDKALDPNSLVPLPPNSRVKVLAPPPVSPQNGASPPTQAVPPPTQVPIPERTKTPPIAPPPRKVTSTTKANNDPIAEPALNSSENPSEPKTFWDSLMDRVDFRDTPSWLVSLIVHLAIIMLLAIVPLSERIGNVITILAGDATEVGDEALTSYEMTSDEPLETVVETAAPSETELLQFEEVETPSIVPAFDMKSPDVAIRKGLSGRTGVMKETLLKAYGGTKGTEDAVAAGLAWLAKQQRSNGSWSLVGPFKGGATSENESAATAMAMLAFLGAGHTHKSDTEYSKNVRNGMSFLMSIQNDDGFFASKAIGNQRTYSQAQCTIAVCELYGLTNDPILEPIAMRAIRYSQRSQGNDGGWRYTPKEQGDMSVTGWYVMGLISARMAGLLVDSQTLDDVQKFLDKVQRRGEGLDSDPQGERYAYMHYTKSSAAMTAEGMLCRLYLGWSASDPRITQGADLLCDNPISPSHDRISFYYWYYATTALHHIGGNYWTRWNDEMKVHLPALQEQSGPQKGSWSSLHDPHDGGGGRLYATCFAIFCLETYYRHLPLNRLGHK